jgi:hypothetical protein
VAHKTGSLDGIGHDVSVIPYGDIAIGLVVMTAKMSLTSSCVAGQSPTYTGLVSRGAAVVMLLD